MKYYLSIDIGGTTFNTGIFSESLNMLAISPKDKRSTKYEVGVSCPNCHDRLSNSQKDRFRMRQKQISLAKKSGKKHIFQKEFN